MIDIPAEVRIAWLKATIRPGSVYKFPEEKFSSTDPHFFIVLNHTPLNDPFIALAVASSRIEKVRRSNSHLPAETMVIIITQCNK